LAFLVCVLGDGGREQTEGSFVALPNLVHKTIEMSTKLLYDSFREQDLSTFFLYFDDHASLIYHSLLPANGVYQGQAGVMAYFERWSRTGLLTNFNYRILYVDEARGESIVESSYEGILLRNNASFSGITSIDFIKWSLGKIRKYSIVDMQPEKLLKLFETKAEAANCKFVESFFKCGACEETLSLLSDDVSLSLPNIYPVSLLSELGLAAAGSQSQSAVTFKGKNPLKHFLNVAYKLVPAHTINAKILYGDKNTVVSALILKPDRVSGFGSVRNVAKAATVLYSISKMNDQGLFSSVELLVNRPFFPWELYQVPQLRAMAMQNQTGATKA